MKSGTIARIPLTRMKHLKTLAGALSVERTERSEPGVGLGRLRRQADAAQQVLEAQVGAQRVEAWVPFDVNQ